MLPINDWHEWYIRNDKEPDNKNKITKSEALACQGLTILKTSSQHIDTVLYGPDSFKFSPSKWLGRVDKRYFLRITSFIIRLDRF